MEIPQIIDFILLGIILIVAVKCFFDGFFTAVINLAGNIAGLIVSWILSNRWAPMVFDRFFKQNIVDKTYRYIQDSANAVDLQQLIGQFAGNLPASFVDKFAGTAQELVSQNFTPSVETAAKITELFIQPIVTLIIGIVIFVICCSLCSLVSNILAKTLKMVNNIPVVGFANRMGGFGVGILIGIVEIIIISCVLSIIAIITQNSLSFINMEVLSQSKILALTGLINPFIG